MSSKSELFFPGWWKYLLFRIVCGIVLYLLCGCSSMPVSQEPKYPEYDKWWTGSGPRRSMNLSELGQGDILVFENGQEAILL